jgi:enoyl-CoA hydratase/carnithine racemase
MTMADALLTTSLSGDLGDAGILRAIKGLARTLADASAVALQCPGDGGGRDRIAMGQWLASVAALPLPVFAIADGLIGGRGVALIAAADGGFVAPGADLAADWREAPGLAPLLHRRLGAAGARALLFGGGGLDAFAAAGLCARSDDPENAARSAARSLGSPMTARRLKRSLIASQELPFTEALAFDLWFVREGAST